VVDGLAKVKEVLTNFEVKLIVLLLNRVGKEV
jgi:hypothetical protein